jgi:diguanylate cyclase (GGDEF)-like protein
MILTDGDALTPDRPALAVTTAAAYHGHRWRRFMIALTAVAGTFASFALFFTVDGWQAHVKELHVANLASDYLQTVNSGLRDATDLLYSLRAYFESRTQPVTRAEFESFSHTLRTRVPGLRDTGWAPRVTASQRDAFERAVRATGFADFEIFERNGQGHIIRAADRPVYFPILFSEPGELDRSVMGFDIGSDPPRQQAVMRALATDKPTAAQPVRLIDGTPPDGGMMSFNPVHPAGSTAGDPPAGVVLGAFETATLIENILATKVRLAGLDMYVFNPGGPAGDRLIFRQAPDNKPTPTQQSLLAMPHWQGTLELLDQRWDVLLIPTDLAAYSAANRTACMALLGGLCATALLVAYLWLSHRRTQQLERLAADLRETSEELRRNGAALDHLARHDALTGLANRMAFRDEVAGGLRRARRGQAMALLYLDLDRFKAVNDTLGHPAGDRLLCEVADRLRATVRESDSITRLGGDEFAIAQTGDEQPEAAENLARRLIEIVSRPYQIDGQIVVVGVSVGITLAEREDVDVDQLLRRADMALYAAKRDGRGTWRFFVNTLEFDAQARRGLEMDLRHALEHGELALYYQPQVSLADGCIRGFEALLRWHHPQRGLVMPGDFIRCAEETSLIVPIGAWVLRTALRVAADWPQGLRVAVNLSPYQLIRDDLVETVERALADSGQPASRLELEITENTLMVQTSAGHLALKHLQTMGVRISMDDFGSDYASLSHMRGFPFDRIKVDRSCVASMTDSSQGGAIVRAILQLTATLNIESLAEGVETLAQLHELAAFGCKDVQGILLSPPQPADAVPALLASWPASDWVVAVVPYRPAIVRIPLRFMTGVADSA